ncbi:MFS transporter [Haloglycomyces albus]|uniref:MFS transporter n=1 Tax=Haloglycomyces albus TaxID=526067 RepID=UPI00046D810A|nr:MFS transporter [Haloglycomyces albus]
MQGSQKTSLTKNQRVLLTLLCGAAFLIVLDTATVVTALPSIQSDLGFSAGGVQWVVTGYSLTFGGLMMLCGRLADRFGGRRMFLIGMTAFIVTSWFCGFAWSSEVLVVSRFAQGAAAALTMPAALSVIMANFPEGGQRNKALGVWSTVGGLGGISGAVVGGPLTDGPGWSWIFYMNIPLALLVVVLSFRFLAADRGKAGGGSFDLSGAATITSSLFLLVWAMSNVPESGWLHPTTLGMLGGSIVLFALFLAVEKRAAYPLVPLRLFRNGTLSGGNVALFLAGMLQGTWFIVTLMAQGVHGFSATQFGLIMVVPAGASIVGAMLGQKVTTAFGTKRVVIVSTLLTALAVIPLLSVTADEFNLWIVLSGAVVMGLVFGVAMVSTSIAALTGVDEADNGIASGIEESTFMIGSPVGIAIAASVAAWVTTTIAPASATQGEALIQGHRTALVVLVAIGLLAPLLSWILMRRDTSSSSGESGPSEPKETTLVGPSGE